MITTFAYVLTGGILAVLATGRTDQIAWRFIRLLGVIVFAVLCAVTAWHLRVSLVDAHWMSSLALWLGAGAGIAAAVVVLLAPLASRLARTFKANCMIGGSLALAAAGLSTLTAFESGREAGVWLTVIVVVSQVLAAVLLGSITVAWLLGHAYLTATSMTIAPLHHFSRVLTWAVIVRSVFVLTSIFIAWLVGGPTEHTVIAKLGQAWLIVLLRVGVGLVALGLFAYMVSDCVRRRSTQSATGILYFGSLFAYIGELANQQLLTECGWPL